MARARRLLDEGQLECVEQGYLPLPIGMERVGATEFEDAQAVFSQAAGIVERFGDPDLAALARHCRGRVLIRMGEIDRGVSLLDGAMVAAEGRHLAARRRRRLMQRHRGLLGYV
jgi:hypothetical protein